MKQTIQFIYGPNVFNELKISRSENVKIRGPINPNLRTLREKVGVVGYIIRSTALDIV